MVLASNTLLILNPLIFRQAIMAMDSHLPRENDLLGDAARSLLGSKVTSLWIWVVILLLIAITSSLFKYGMRMTFITVSRDVEQEVRSKIFNKIQNQSMAFFDRYGVGELLSRLTNDISAYRDVLGPGILYPLFFLTIMTPGLIALFTISVPLASLSALPLLVIPLVNFFIRGYIYRIALSVQKGLGELSDMVQEHFSAIRIVKSYGVESILCRRFQEVSRKLLALNLRFASVEGSLFPFFTLLTKLLTVLLVMLSGIIILRGWSELSTADFVSFMWIQSYIFFPVLMLGWLIPVYERGRAAYGRLVEIYEEPIEVQDTPGADLRIPVGANIAFHNLTFTYPTGKSPALSHLNLEIQGGDFVGIAGPIGAGKTTLFRLLTREYETPGGSILINNRDIHRYPLKAFHGEIVTVEQIPFLFSKSIRENVRFGKQKATQQEVEVVTGYADFHDSVLEFPEQYETIIGEGGVTLSGGQKQRLAMARAFLVNRSILLLDDIFSAVDSATEKKILKAMRENFQGKTVLLITHRISILEQMDRVIYLSEGTVVEDGPPERLVKQNGHYAALVELQRIGK